MSTSSISGTKMSDYTPLANNEKDYFMGDGQGAVVTVGKVEQGGDNVNRLVKLSDLAPAESVSDVTVGGTSVVSNGVAAVPAVPSASTLAGTGLTANNGALDVSNPVPSAGTNEHRGDVLTVDNTDQVVWAAPQGGGGWTYTKATGTFGEKTESPFPGEYSNQTTRELPVSNHTYTVVPNNVDTGGGYNTQVVIIKLEQSEFPDAYVQFKTSDSNVTSLHHIVVDNGSTRLIRLYNAGAISDGAVYEVQAYLEDNQEIEVHAPTTWNEKFPGNESTVLIHIFGDTYTIYCSGNTMYNGNAE